MINKTLGGDRLGSGNKQTVALKTYERSSHDQGYIFKTTMSAGTLVPFINEVGLLGTSFDIELDAEVLTHPTVGPLFGSYKVQLDVFCTPIRLYQASLHMNKLNIALSMADIKLPQIEMIADSLRAEDDTDNAQINPSTIFAYQNIRGLGWNPELTVKRRFNAIGYLNYFDIFKNYYANKQEEFAYIIHNELTGSDVTFSGVKLYKTRLGNETLNEVGGVDSDIQDDNSGSIRIAFETATDADEFEMERVNFTVTLGAEVLILNAVQAFGTVTYDDQDEVWWLQNYLNPYNLSPGQILTWNYYEYDSQINDDGLQVPKLYEFELDKIDEMREQILQAPQDGTPFIIDENTEEPYGLPFKRTTVEFQNYYSKKSSQEGLLVKTYQSDLFNNWVNTDWIDGANGINEISKVITDVDGNFTIDELNLKNRIFNMLMRSAVAGGTYDDWQEVQYTEQTFKRPEVPMYHGGLIKELAFQSVISNAETETQPLGTLAGRGILTGKHKGGRVHIKCREISHIQGIVSITPRLDYSQGNKWDTNLKTMDDFHKPALDQIGFQILNTDQMAYWDTLAVDATAQYADPIYRSAGKQPAWINYMTNVNITRGNFAVTRDQMFMTLNRQYEPEVVENYRYKIMDLTTYIDPVKFNNIFAYTRLDAQNFWVQIKVGMKTRRKMSGKLMPNL